MQFFFLDSITEQIRDKDFIRQLTKVLRYKLGDKFYLLDGKGSRVLAEIKNIKSGKSVELSFIRKENFKRPDKKICLFQALPKLKAKWEFVLQKATELGIDEIVPIKTEFTQAKYDPWKERQFMIVKEASEQSERIFLPKMGGLMDFNDVFKSNDSVNFFFESSDPSLPTQFDIKQTEKVNIIIGPEGGFSKDEIGYARKQKNTALLSLGKQILRLETATIVALARLHF